MTEDLLDNPIWNALGTEHSGFAVVSGEARRYISDVGPLSGIPLQSEEHFEALRALTGPGGVLVLFLPDRPQPGAGWKLIREDMLTQMIWRGNTLTAPEKVPDGVTMRRLSIEDVSQMIELVELTEPGPFRRRTLELGVFYGIFEGGRLASMAGQRMSVPGLREVSAVCTHPEFRGRGYAAILMSAVMQEIVSSRRIPFLHALASNQQAISVYRKLGFEERRLFHLAVVQNEG